MKIERICDTTFESLRPGAVFECNGKVFWKFKHPLYALGCPDPSEYTEVNAIDIEADTPGFFEKSAGVRELLDVKLIIGRRRINEDRKNIQHCSL